MASDTAVGTWGVATSAGEAVGCPAGVAASAADRAAARGKRERKDMTGRMRPAALRLGWLRRRLCGVAKKPRC